MEHKHKDLIIAWANGAIIQVLVGKTWFDAEGNSPCWEASDKYRIKPTPKPDVIKYFNLYNRYSWDHFPILHEAKGNGSATSLGVVQLVLDGETGKPKSVELVNV